MISSNKSAKDQKTAFVNLLSRSSPPDSLDLVKHYLKLRKQEFGEDEKDYQRNIKCCDGSVERYVRKVWQDPQHLALLRHISHMLALVDDSVGDAADIIPTTN